MELSATRTDDRTESASGATSTLLAPAWRRVDGHEEQDGTMPLVEEPEEPDSPDAGAAAPQRSNLAIWLVLAALGLAVLVGVVADARVGVLGISATLAGCGAVRAVSRTEHVGLTVRSRSADVLLFWTLATTIAFLGVTSPDV